MKVYRNSYKSHGGQHFGYEFFLRKKAADEARFEWLARSLDNPHGHDVVQDKLEITMNKHEVVKALNEYGGHPDNG